MFDITHLCEVHLGKGTFLFLQNFAMVFLNPCLFLDLPPGLPTTVGLGYRVFVLIFHLPKWGLAWGPPVGLRPNRFLFFFVTRNLFYKGHGHILTSLTFLLSLKNVP